MTASDEYHIGVDYHQSYSRLVVQDSSGKTLRSGRVKNDCRARLFIQPPLKPG
ncbi:MULTISPECIES: hypothetical protein [unclassified Mesorhizobium]|uniref:hypothetical protein n=1 Tax=unclassified Mesorhizobium TaxID=325217 RepID=UPI000AC584DA|nr:MULTISPECIES: hypothetical protein [Mesorhizobium]